MFETFERVSTFLNLVKILNHIFRKRSKPHLLMILINLNKVAFYTKKNLPAFFFLHWICFIMMQLYIASRKFFEWYVYPLMLC